jgi:hypothetical protein
MESNTTSSLNRINPRASIGTRGKNYFILNPPIPVDLKKKLSITAKPNTSKRTGCSGCSRRRGNRGG